MQSISPKAILLFYYLFIFFLSDFVYAQQLPLDRHTAFPGAYGFGRGAKGGRGGDVYHVINLNDSGNGSLRYGIQNATGPRTIIFDISGNILLNSILTINKSNLTIAGQTTPGDGITIAGYPVSVEHAKNVIIRYIRFRCGDFNAVGEKGLPSKGNGDLAGKNAGALDIGHCDSVIIDHVSSSWSIDEILSVTNSNNITVQNSIISESLNNSYHDKGVHGFGSLIRGNGKGGYTFYKNLYAHNNGRNPGTGSNQQDVTLKLELDFVNNIIYGWGNRAAESVGGSLGGMVEINYVGNYSIANMDSRNKNSVWDEEKTVGIMMYQHDNKLDNNLNAILNGVDNGWMLFQNFTDEQKMSVRYNYPEVPVLRVDDAFANVIKDAGASLRRDSVDNRIIRQLKNRTGKIIDSQLAVGGLPTLNTLPPPKDTDQDGMPDLWESKYSFLNKSDPGDRNRYDLSSDYTNLEVYLNGLLRK